MTSCTHGYLVCTELEPSCTCFYLVLPSYRRFNCDEIDFEPLAIVETPSETESCVGFFFFKRNFFWAFKKKVSFYVFTLGMDVGSRPFAELIISHRRLPSFFYWVFSFLFFSFDERTRHWVLAPFLPSFFFGLTVTGLRYLKKNPIGMRWIGFSNRISLINY